MIPKKMARQAAQQVAKQVQEETRELVKTAKSQVLGQEKLARAKQQSQMQQPQAPQKDAAADYQRRTEEETKRRLTYLQEELAKIAKEEEFKKFQKIEAAQVQAQAQEKPQKTALAEPTTRPSRKFLGGVKRKLQGLKTRVETRLPPTG